MWHGRMANSDRKPQLCRSSLAVVFNVGRGLAQVAWLTAAKGAASGKVLMEAKGLPQNAMLTAAKGLPQVRCRWRPWGNLGKHC